MNNIKSKALKRMSILVVLIVLLAIDDAFGDPHVTIDASQVVEPIQHRAAGALYGFSNRTPTDEYLKPIRPQFLRMASGRNAELASEDFSNNPYCVFDMYGRAAKLGVRRIEVMCNLYAPKTWLTWDAEQPEQSLSDWLDRLERIARLKVQRDYELVYYDLFNEPDINGGPDKTEIAAGRKGQKDGFTALGNGDWSSGFHRAWQKSCERVRAVDPQAKIVGPSFAGSGRLEEFLVYCRDRDCLPDVLSFHQLGHYGGVTKAIQNIRGLMRRLGIDELALSINEYASSRELGRPHHSCMYICQIEREEVDTGITAYWFAPGTFGSILNAYGQVRSGWWLYKWYGQMRGQVLASRRGTPWADTLACLDVEGQQIALLFTANEKVGPQGRIRITSLHRIPFLQQADECRVSLSRTPYGVNQEPALIYSKNVPLQGELDVVVPYLSNEAAFRVIIGPATDEPHINALDAAEGIVALQPVEIAPSQHGLQSSLYRGTFPALPNFAKLDNAKRGTVDTFEIHREKKRSDRHQPKMKGTFAVSFEGYVNITTKNVYSFYLQSIGGSRLYINNRLVADNGTTPELGPDQGQVQYNKEMPEAHGQIALDRGFHRIRVEYMVQGIGELLVYFSSPNLPKCIIPKESLWR